MPLSSYFSDQLRKHGFQYDLSDHETLNVQAYECPFCGSNDRDRLIALYLDTQLSNRTSADILEFAPSRNLKKYLTTKYPFVNYRTADLFMDGVDDKVDILDMSQIYTDNQFDFIINSHVLEHVLDDQKAMSELYRICRPNGALLALVPIFLTANAIDEDIHETNIGNRWKRFGQDDHVRLYSRDAFIQRLKKVGFNITFGDRHLLKDDRFEAHGIKNTSTLYIGQK
jgi:SAM-dependent methyltransferase